MKTILKKPGKIIRRRKEAGLKDRKGNIIIKI